MTTFTFKEISAIRLALTDVAWRTELPGSSKCTMSALVKIEDVLDKRCTPRQYSAYVLLPLLAKNDEE